MSVTALSLITAAFAELNTFLPTESIPSADATAALGYLNRMIGIWSVESLTIPAVAREVFALTANKGGPSNPYTIGTGGNLNTARPASQASVAGAGLLLNASSPAVEIPRAVITDDAYQAIQVKELTSTLFTSVYYSPTFATSFYGTILLWPVPDNAVNSLVLYLQKALTTFTDLATAYEVPQGAEDALLYNLARRLAKPWGAVLDTDLIDKAATAKRIYKRSNLKMSDLSNDFAVDRRGRYNIQTGTGG